MTPSQHFIDWNHHRIHGEKKRKRRNVLIKYIAGLIAMTGLLYIFGVFLLGH